jgi:hypothetical protein
MALQNPASDRSILAELALIGASAHETGQRLLAAITRRVQDVFDPYRPELHYMRGPGPRWREKHGIAARNRQIVTFQSD